MCCVLRASQLRRNPLIRWGGVCNKSAPATLPYAGWPPLKDRPEWLKAVPSASAASASASASFLQMVMEPPLNQSRRNPPVEADTQALGQRGTADQL